MSDLLTPSGRAAGARVTGGATIRVAIVDDSFFIRHAIERMLARDARMRVVGAAGTGEELLENLYRWRPHVITLDLEMPGMGGLQTLDRIMEERPTPVIVLSSHARLFAPVAIEALHRGAVDFVDKQSYSLVDFSGLGDLLTEKILQLTGAGPQPASPPPLESGRAAPAPAPAPAPSLRATRELVVVGASTGGPVAIERVLSAVGPDLATPVAIVQHMPAGFTRSFAERLNSLLPLSVREASDGEVVGPGDVRIGPAGRHLVAESATGGIRLRLEEEPSDVSHRPSVDRLFGSAAALGAGTVGVLLTGMGRDGARGMAELSAAGAYTLAQDQQSSVVFGMPRAALAAGAVREMLPLERIGGRIVELLRDDE